MLSRDEFVKALFKDYCKVREEALKEDDKTLCLMYSGYQSAIASILSEYFKVFITKDKNNEPVLIDMHLDEGESNATK